MQPAWHVNDKWTLFYRYDSFEPGTLDSTNDPDRTEHVLGINYDPLTSVRLRLSGAIADFDSPANETIEMIQASVTVSF